MHDPHKSGESSLKVFIFNVGAGDNLLLQLPNGEFGLIDFYYDSKQLGLGEPPSLTYLRNYASENNQKPVISFVCISHADSDHMKGVDYFRDWVVSQGIRIDTVMTFSGWDFDDMNREIKRVRDERTPKAEPKRQSDRVVRQFEALAQLRGPLSKKRPEYIHDVRPLDRIGDPVEITGIGPLGDQIQRLTKKSITSFCRFLVFGDAPGKRQRNDVSAVLKLKYKSHILLFTGDISEKFLSECLDHYDQQNFKRSFGSLSANFVKAPHHGAKTSSSVGFWKRILREQYIVGISAGRDHNHRPRHGHPHAETLRDIAQGRRRLSSKRQILSTNVCANCVDRQKRSSVDMEWAPEIASETRQQLKQDRSNPYKFRVLSNPTPPPGLAAHILSFNRNGTTSVQWGVSGKLPCWAECLYSYSAGQHFPDCGLALKSGSSKPSSSFKTPRQTKK